VPWAVQYCTVLHCTVLHCPLQQKQCTALCCDCRPLCVCRAQKLYTLGLRNFVLLNVGPVGCVPLVKAIPVWGSRSCMANANNLARAHNAQFAAAMGAFRTRHPDAKAVVLDVFQGFYGTAAAKSASLYSPLLHCTVLCCSVLYCAFICSMSSRACTAPLLPECVSILSHTVQDSTVLHSTVMLFMPPPPRVRRPILHCTVQYSTLLCSTVSYCTALYCAVLCYTVHVACALVCSTGMQCVSVVDSTLILLLSWGPRCSALCLQTSP